ncbi:unnamed protein product [Effrenium voratum]|nr:unnamed protein product [Effrenium voratum]
MDRGHGRVRQEDPDRDENDAPPLRPEDEGGFYAAWDPAIYSALKYSIVRISTVDRGVDMDKPYEDAGIQESVGSGFLVDDNTTMKTEDDYTIVTNAHVVRGSEKVRVQFPSLGRHLFDATAPVICFQFDLAIVKLKDPLELKEKLKKANVTLSLLKLQAQNVKMGMRVAALGFPLGSQWLKLSEGVVSGAEVVEDNMVYQSTAPISPGNSGGPLLVFRDRLMRSEPRSEEGMSNAILDTVVGVNFASSASKSAQNLNYAVPAFRIVQVLHAYSRMTRMSEEDCDCDHKLDQFGRGNRHHMEFRIAPVGVVYTQATQAHLRKLGCRGGVPLDRFMPFSLFRWARPPIPVGSFLMKVDDTELDTFGMGKRFEYMQQYVSFKDLLTFREHLDDDVTVLTCMDGKQTEHTLSLKWNSSRFEGGIRYLYEPNYDDSAKDYEWFAGLTMVQLTLNHVDSWIQAYGGETLGRFYLEENTLEPKVAITSCASGFSCEEIVGTGMIVESVNGCAVSTLADIRRCFLPKIETWQLVTDRGVILTVDFVEELTQTVRLVHEDLSLLSKAVRDAALALSNGSETQANASSKGKANRTKKGNESESGDNSDSKRVGEQADAEDYLQAEQAKKQRNAMKRRHQASRAAQPGEKPRAQTQGADQGNQTEKVHKHKKHKHKKHKKHHLPEDGKDLDAPPEVQQVRQKLKEKYQFEVTPDAGARPFQAESGDA